MKCDNIRKDLGQYFDGEVSDERRREVEAHLEDCGDCRAALDDLRLSWEALDAYSVESGRASSASVILKQARAGERRALFLRVGTGLAAALLIAAIVWQFGFPGGTLSNGVTAMDKREIVTDWEVLDNLDVLEDLEVLEDLDLLEDIPDDLLDGKEKG